MGESEVSVEVEQTKLCETCEREFPVTSFERNGELVDECYRCRVLSVGIGTPRDFPSRTRSKGEPARPNNSYEAGIPVDHRGMPWLGGPDLHPMHTKEFNSNRHLIEETRRRNHQQAAPPNPREVN